MTVLLVRGIFSSWKLAWWNSLHHWVAMDMGSSRKGPVQCLVHRKCPINDISLNMYVLYHFYDKMIQFRVNPRSLFSFLIYVNTTAFDLREQLHFDLQELISVNPTESWGYKKQQFWHSEIIVLHPAEESVWLPSQLPSSNYEPTLRATRLIHWCYQSHIARIQLRGWLAIKKLQAVREHSQDTGWAFTQGCRHGQRYVCRSSRYDWSWDSWRWVVMGDGRF